MDYEPVKRRSRVARILCVLLIIAVAIAIALGVLLFLNMRKDKTNETLCQTPECIAASSQILSNMDSKIDPCDDFYQFACGEFIKKTVIPTSKGLVDSFSVQTNIIDQQIHTILEEPINAKDSRTIQLVKKVYQACMNETDIELHSMNTIKAIIHRLGGWPVVEGYNWNEASFDWIETLLKLRDSGMVYSMFMDFIVEQDNKNSSKRVLTVDQPYIPFEKAKRESRNQPILNAAHKFMVDLAVEFGANRNVAEREMEEILLFEMDLAKILVPAEERRDMEEEYHPISIMDLEKNFPILPWHYFVNKLVAPSNLSITDNLIVYLPEYLKKLQALLQGKPKRLLANYIFYKAAGSMISYSNRKLKAIQLEFTKAAMGIASSPPRTEQCTSVASRLNVVVGALYIRKYFDANDRTQTEEIVENIEEQFMKLLRNVDWMDQETKNQALEKLKAMDKFVGYPGELMDDSKLEEYYNNLHINSDNYVEVILNVSKFETDKDMKQLSEPVIKLDWRTRSSVAVVNAYYDLNANAIQVPAGILQGIFFGAKRPHYLNYGGIGFIIGHEFTHGFDDEGSQMDAHGNLREWWKGNTKTAYDKKAECIVDQYSKFVVPEVNMSLNGIITQGENIADNGGIKLAYLAYQDWKSKNNPEPKLPGLNFSPDQMFWIGSANVWCSKIRAKTLVQDIESEVHVPDRFRINVPFANSGFFAKDFNCPKGSKMNPEHTCTVW
ncbi:hypothetical protein HHI36_004152 [Cryptolaemus montrouzieri]|uniref:Neprilysin n=1 Tax=Cryptolaemus montrouzieri TaxID=559131 RepID=A0ABD2NQC7_9CUCU